MNRVFDQLTQQLQPQFSPELAQQATELYGQFLTLCGKYADERLVPPQLADHAWHKHLESDAYATDVQAHCGRVVEHHTDGVEADLEQGWQRSKALYWQEFGVDLETLSDQARTAANCVG